MFERTIKYVGGCSSGFSTTTTLTESLELLLSYAKNHGGISEITIKLVDKPTYSDKDLADLAGFPRYRR